MPGIPQTTATFNERRADQRIADYRLVLNGSDAYYDAGRVSLVLPRRHNLAMDVSYWFSKAIDLGSSYTNTAYDADSRIGRSQSEFETHKDLKAPQRIRPAARVPVARLLHDARRLAHLQRLDRRGDHAAQERHAVHGGQRVGRARLRQRGWERRRSAEPARSRRSSAARSAIPTPRRACCRRRPSRFIRPTDAAGNLGRNTFRRGGIHNVNASLSRAWALRSDMRLTFRAESINFFNTPQFAEPGLELSSPNFGQITNTLNDGRTFRLSLQFAY